MLCVTFVNFENSYFLSIRSTKKTQKNLNLSTVYSYLRYVPVSPVSYFYILEGSLPRAYGVEYSDSNGFRHVAATKPGGEVLLTAGAIGSTQLLLLSGVGPANKLEPWNLTQIVKLDSVGRNVTDIPINPIGVLSPRAVETSALEVRLEEGGRQREAVNHKHALFAFTYSHRDCPTPYFHIQPIFIHK